MIEDPHKQNLIEISGSRIPVWIYGNEKNYPIIFVHGYFRGFSDYVGDLPMRYLRKAFCVYAFDLPGFGKSKGLSMDTVGFVNEVIKKTIGKRRFTLFGVSYGGAVALKYALNFPDKVDGVIIAGTPYGGRFSLFRFLFLPEFILPTLSRFISDFRIMNKKNLSQIKKPVLLLYGSSDVRASLGMAKNLKVALGADLAVYDRTHGWLLHRIDESGFLRAIEKFLRPFVKR